MKSKPNRPAALARDLPGLCILLQGLFTAGLTGFLVWLFITSELL